MKQKYSTTILTLLALCLVVLGCNLIKEGKPAAENSIAEFHQQLNDGKYVEIYETSHKLMKDNASEEDMVKLLSAVHTKLGAVKSSTNQSWRVQNYNLVSSIEMVQNTEFENGKGTETFTFVVEDKKAILAGYYINSMDLVVK